MISNKKTARIAGFLYLVVVLTGVFSLMYVPATLIVWNNPSETFQNILQFNLLFRWGIIAESLCFTAFLLLPLVLYKLLHTVNRYYAVAMVALAVPSVPILFSNLMNKFAILELLNTSITTHASVSNEVLFYLHQFNNGNLIGQNFWALWLFPLGWLVYKSGILPKVLGVLLMVGSVGYYLDFLARILFTEYRTLGISDYLTLPASLGEIGTCLWLLVMGAKEYPRST